MSQRPARDHAERVQPGVAAHPDDVATTAVPADSHLFDQVSAQSGGEKAGGGDAAQVAQIGRIQTDLIQTAAQGLGAELQRGLLVLVQQFALRL